MYCVRVCVCASHTCTPLIEILNRIPKALKAIMYVYNKYIKIRLAYNSTAF